MNRTAVVRDQPQRVDPADVLRLVFDTAAVPLVLVPKSGSGAQGAKIPFGEFSPAGGKDAGTTFIRFVDIPSSTSDNCRLL